METFLFMDELASRSMHVTHTFVNHRFLEFCLAERVRPPWPLVTLWRRNVHRFAAGGAREAYAGLLASQELMARFVRLRDAVAALLPSVGKRLQWLRLGPAMLRGEMSLSAWILKGAPLRWRR